MVFIQQGDVLLKSANIPPGARKRQGRLVLAEGRHTGYAHVAEGIDVEIYENKRTIYLKAPRGAAVHHEEHKPVQLPPGDYRIGRVREYDHFGEKGLRARD
jgi:hypothetical protein